MATLADRRAASTRALAQVKNVTSEDAKRIREIWRTVTNRQEARDLIDGVLRTCGVEYLGRHTRTGGSVYYCNAGDTYSTTVLFHGLRMYVGCWGDLVERNGIISD